MTLAERDGLAIKFRQSVKNTGGGVRKLVQKKRPQQRPGDALGSLYSARSLHWLASGQALRRVFLLVPVLKVPLVLPHFPSFGEAADEFGPGHYRAEREEARGCSAKEPMTETTQTREKNMRGARGLPAGMGCCCFSHNSQN